jgi:RNA recognition motif-containing protein
MNTYHLVILFKLINFIIIKNMFDKKNEFEESKEEQKKEVFVNSVYVEGIPYDTTQDDITKFFEDCGEIM